MRPTVIALPSVLALLCAGGMFAVAMRNKPSHSGNDFYSAFEWRHYVTPPMVKAANERSGLAAEAFKLKDVQGAEVTIGGQALRRPELVYFVNTECPCSYAAEPLFHSLAQQFHGQVDFIAVTNADAKATKQWISEADVPYPVVSDPSVDIMRAYGAPSSVYAALVTRDGRIRKLWPGFSSGILHDMNHEMALATAQPERPFDTQYAPEKQATGCSFGIERAPEK